MVEFPQRKLGNIQTDDRRGYLTTTATDPADVEGVYKPLCRAANQSMPTTWIRGTPILFPVLGC